MVTCKCLIFINNKPKGILPATTSTPTLLFCYLVDEPDCGCIGSCGQRSHKSSWMHTLLLLLLLGRSCPFQFTLPFLLCAFAFNTPMAYLLSLGWSQCTYVEKVPYTKWVIFMHQAPTYYVLVHPFYRRWSLHLYTVICTIMDRSYMQWLFRGLPPVHMMVPIQCNMYDYVSILCTWNIVESQFHNISDQILVCTYTVSTTLTKYQQTCI